MASAAPLNIRIVSLQTVVPTKLTEPNQSRQLTLSGPLRPETLQSRLRVVLYYRRKEGEDSARTLAAWIKVSLGEALSEQPGLAGRLRKDGEEEGYWEVKFNDAGVRLVQASADTTVEEVLKSKEMDGMEDQLCYWQDVDVENPNFSALFFIQVTEFQGDGYSIGISCNLLLADPLVLSKFLNNWAATHKLMLEQKHLSELPIFHLDYFNKSCQAIQIKPIPSDSHTTAATTTTTMLFKASVAQESNYWPLIAHCIKETSKKLEGRVTFEFSVLVSDRSSNLEVNSSNKCGSPPSDVLYDGTIDVAWWNELGLEKMALTGGKPVHLSYHIVSSIEQGIVVAMVTSSGEDGDSEVMVSVTVPRMI